MDWKMRAALKQKGCPVCRLSGEGVEYFWRWFVIEYYHSKEMMESLSRGGFCRLHAWQAAAVAGQLLSAPLSYAVATRKDSLRAVLAAVSPEPSRWRRLFSCLRRWAIPGRVLAEIFTQELCPVCEMIQQEEQIWSGVLLRMLESLENKDLYRGSDGLCWKHFTLAVARAGREVAVFLTEDLITRLETLEGQFSEYFRKRDYRFAQEPKGEEQQAWLKALEILMGGIRPAGEFFGSGNSSSSGRAFADEYISL